MSRIMIIFSVPHLNKNERLSRINRGRKKGVKDVCVMYKIMLYLQ